MTKRFVSLMAMAAVFAMAAAPALPQPVLFSADFDGMDDGVVPEGWTQVFAGGHQEATEDPTVDWKVISARRFVAFDFGGGDQVRDQMGYFRLLDADGNPDETLPVGDFLSMLNPPPSGSANWRRQGGDRSPWKNPPYMTMGQLPDGTYPDGAGILVADSDQYGGANFNAGIDSPRIALNGSAWVRVNFDAFIYGNQDQSSGNWYRLDDGPWRPLNLQDNQTHGDDMGYAGHHSYAIETAGASTIQLRWWLCSNFGWFYVVDNLEVVGYDGIPADGPAKPVLEFPSGAVSLDGLTEMRSGAYGDPSGGTHVFSEWEVRHEGGTYGDLVQFDDEAFLIDSPVLRTSQQPNQFSLNAVVPGDNSENNDTARSEDPPYEPVLFGRENAGGQFKIDLAGDQTVLPLPESLFRPGRTYYARVRHWNNGGVASPWSDEVQFTVAPVASETVLDENFDGGYDDLLSKGWDVEWLDVELNILQTFGQDLIGFRTTEPDGRGVNGHFEGVVLHAGEGGAPHGAVVTPVIDNTNGGDLTLVFDSAFRTNVTGQINVVVNDGEPVLLEEIGASMVLKQQPDISAIRSRVIWHNSFALAAPGTAGQSNVRFQFVSNGGGDDWWTIDNVTVQRGEPASVADWEVR